MNQDSYFNAATTSYDEKISSLIKEKDRQKLARELQNLRFQSTTSSTSQTSTASSASSSHIAAGLAGGLASATVLYILYRMSPSGQIATKINKTAKEAEKKYQQAASTLQTKAPSTDEAVQRVKEFCYSYVAFIPGGRQYVDTAFKDFESVREKNRDEVDKIVQETYKQVQDVAKTGLSMESVTRVWECP